VRPAACNETRASACATPMGRGKRRRRGRGAADTGNDASGTGERGASFGPRAATYSTTYPARYTARYRPSSPHTGQTQQPRPLAPPSRPHPEKLLCRPTSTSPRSPAALVGRRSGTGEKGPWARNEPHAACDCFQGCTGTTHERGRRVPGRRGPGAGRFAPSPTPAPARVRARRARAPRAAHAGVPLDPRSSATGRALPWAPRLARGRGAGARRPTQPFDTTASPPPRPNADAFADAPDSGSPVSGTTGTEWVHVRVQQRNGRKSLTTVQVRARASERGRLAGWPGPRGGEAGRRRGARRRPAPARTRAAARASAPPPALPLAHPNRPPSNPQRAWPRATTTRRCSRPSRRSSAATATSSTTPSWARRARARGGGGGDRPLGSPRARARRPSLAGRLGRPTVGRRWF
jgi:hypothetical protein